MCRVQVVGWRDVAGSLRALAAVELRLKRAIRAGDTIHVTSEIVSLEPSKTRTDRGTAMTRYAVVLEDGTEAVTFTSINLVYTRGARERMAGTAR